MSALTLFAAAAGAAGQPVDLPKVAYGAVMPEIILGGGALALLLFIAVVRTRFEAKYYAGYALLLSSGVLVHTWWSWKKVTASGRRSAFNGTLAHDHFALLFTIIVAISLILAILLIERWLDRREQAGPEWFVTALLAAAGAILMASANDLVVIFVGMELVSLGLYVLTGYRITHADGREAALKALVLGGLFTAIFAFGVSLVYGALGTTNLSSISTFLTANVLVDEGLFFAGMVLVLAGLVGKIGAAPFHAWKIDVPLGAPVPAAGFLGLLPLLGGGAALLRVFDTALWTQQVNWKPIVLVLAILSVLAGAVGSFVQRDLRRILAFASVAHVGFFLFGLQPATSDGADSALFYLVTYAVMVLGCFAVLSLVDDADDHRIEAYRGLARRHPLVGFAFLVLLLAQIGMPLTSGFVAKFYVVVSLMEVRSYGAAVFLVLATVVLAVSFIRVLAVLYAEPVATQTAGGQTIYGVKYGQSSALVGKTPVWMDFSAVWIALGLSVVFTIAAGTLPEHWFDVLGLVRSASTDLF